MNAATLFLRKMAIVFLFLMLIVYIVFAILYAKHDAPILKSLMYLYTVQHIIWLFGIIYYKDLSIESLITMYLSYVLVTIIYPLGCIFWNSGSPVVFSWFLLILFGAMAFHVRNIEVWIFLTLAIVVSIFFVSCIFPKDNITQSLLKDINITTVILTIILTIFFAMVYVKKKNIDKSMHVETLKAPAGDLEKNKALYNSIIEYLEKNKPFKNSDFNVQELAKALNSSISDISKAITAGGDGDFHTLLNRFRINYVKSMLDSEAMKIYTIDYIYTEAGYKYRSTFNNAFKTITGMTPSDYISKQTNNNP